MLSSHPGTDPHWPVQSNAQYTRKLDTLFLPGSHLLRLWHEAPSQCFWLRWVFPQLQAAIFYLLSAPVAVIK